MWYKIGVEKIRDASEMKPPGNGEARRFLFESDNRDRRALIFLFWTVVSALAIYGVWETLR